MHDRWNVIRNNLGKPIAIEGIVRDETDRKRAEEVLLESEERHRQLFSTVSDPIMIFDAETKQFVDVNGAALYLYGYTKEEFLKLTQPDITAEPVDSESSIKQTLSGEIKGIPLRYHKKKDGTTFPVEISTGVFKSGDRQLLCGVIRDITDRKMADEALRESKEELRTIVDSAPVQIWYKI